MKNWFYFFGLTIELAILVVFLSSCMKEPKFEQEFGPEVSAQEVDKAIREVETVSPYTIKQGEFAYLERTTQVETQPAIVVLQRGDTITEKTEDSDNYIFTIVSDLVELIDGQMKPSRKESTATLPKEQTGPVVHSMSLQSVHALDGTDAKKVTYHNLQKGSSFYPVPGLVQRRANCGGLSEKLCMGPLPVTRLSFDKVEWKGEVGTKTSFLFVFSKDIPYFASQLLGCAETMVPYQDQRVHVTQCEEIKDFTAGHD
jgi:hypothetical protein